jgi:membrane protease YdiL (CAAX protease family)
VRDADDSDLSPGNPPSDNVSATVEPAVAPTPWTLRNLLVLVITSLLALLAANFLVVAGYGALQPLMGWPKSVQAVHDNPFLLLALQSVFHALLLLTVYLFIVVNHRLPFWHTLQWRTPTAGKVVRFFLGGIALAVVIQLMPTLLPDRPDFPLTRLFTSPQAGYAIAAFAILIAPFMEELIFRGVLFAFFEHLVGNRFAVLATAALFASLHVSEYWGAWNHVLLILLVGLVFSAARSLTGSLAPSVILHTAYNASLMAGLYLQTHQFRHFQETLLP